MSLPPLRLAVLCDFPEENWASMNLCAEMLLDHIGPACGGRIVATRVCPPFQRRLSPLLGKRRGAFNADRLVNRFWDFPQYVLRLRHRFDFFHVVDHSYSQLLHRLPARRAGVYCHDLDTFRCILHPEQEPRPPWFRWMARRILTGFQKATVVFHTTQTVREQILAHQLITAERLIHAPNGVSPEFLDEPTTEVGLPADFGSRPYLLHVGSCIQRKRIDVLLEVFAILRARWPDLQLVQGGGEFSLEQQTQISRLGLEGHAWQQRGIPRAMLANLYRHARLVLQTSDAEGFGLPVIEALACGAIVVASDLPVLREIGATAVVYAPVADIPSWVKIADGLLHQPELAPPPHLRRSRAELFSWQAQARAIGTAYQSLSTNISSLNAP